MVAEKSTASLSDVLERDGLSKEDVRFIVENKFVAQQVAAGITEVCHEVRACLEDLGDQSPTHGLQARRLLFGGRFPSNKGEYLLLRIARGCLKAAEKNPGKKVTQKKVANELRITPQRMSQLTSDLKKNQDIEFDQLLARLDLS